MAATPPIPSSTMRTGTTPLPTGTTTLTTADLTPEPRLPVYELPPLSELPPGTTSDDLLARYVPVPRGGGQSAAVSLLRAGIPLTLLMDLAGPDPHSAELYALEGRLT